MKKLVLLALVVITFTCTTGFTQDFPQHNEFNRERNCEFSEQLNQGGSISLTENPEQQEKPSKNFIRWIEFNVSSGMMRAARTGHEKLLAKGVEDIGTCELLAYVALKNANKFNLKKDTATLNKLMKELLSGNRENIDKYAGNKYFNYYVEAFHAVLDGIICPNTAKIIGYHPIAKGFWQSGYDDFGSTRTYGFKRRHLGHDLYGGVGTPIIATEGGVITELGWNRYGGWRVGIRSHCTKRYYYYAHLRKDKPFPAHLSLGSEVSAGDVIGFLGNTGYSRQPNTNMQSSKPHLHFGMQIIFDKSQEDGGGEIWIDVYQICNFLSKHKMKTVKNADGVHEAVR